MAHNRNFSLDSSSSLTSISSHDSIESYKSIKPTITEVEQSPTSLQDLVNDAERIINERFAPDPQSTFEYKKGSDMIPVDLAAVMRAMLACAQECGGEEGKRYVASAVVACSRNGDVVKTLAALGTTWLTHLLFIFKTSRSHETQPNQHPSRLATPTLETTATHVLEGVGNRQTTFADAVKIRDGYRCLLTKFQDEFHPAPDESVTTAYLEACHILRRAIGNFDSDQQSDSYKSAVTTFDILVNFTRLPLKTLEDLHDHLDDPSNGMMLQGDAHKAFDNFRWCLKKTDVVNEYTTKIYRNAGNVTNRPEGTLIVFRDHSNDFISGSARKRKNRSVSLPDPHYIAIHAAIAGILHMSGAGKFFDEILDRYKDGGGQMPPVRCWPDLERRMEEELLRESVMESFQSVGVH